MKNTKTASLVRSLIIGLVIVILISCSFIGGLAVGSVSPLVSRIVPSLSATPSRPASTPTEEAPGGTPSDLKTLFQAFWEAWNIVHSDYLFQPVDDTKLVDGAIRGMLEALEDPYTGYWNKTEAEDAQRALEGEYEGIGAWVDTEGDYLTIIEPMPGSPAEAVGLRKGDQIIAVDGEDVTGQSPEDVRLFKVLGPAGTQVTLTILRPGVEKPFDVTITRAHIVVPSVSSKILEGDIGYLQVNQFGEKTADEVHAILEDFHMQGVRGIILDLRNNPGGLTTTATQIASEFIGKGVIWYEEYGDGQRYEYKAEPGGLALDLPLVVLVNEYSASASELVAGALQDYGRAKLVGVTTYGKGVVQTWQPLSNGGVARVTIARFLTPNGRSIHKTGLTPDIVVEMSEEDYEAGRDPQLEAAIQALKEAIQSP